jgi:hypothetical protein
MTTVELGPAKAWHCGAILRSLRVEHQVGLARVQPDSHRELRKVFDASVFRKALFLDGRLAGIGGVTGTLACDMGYVWLALSQEATRHPVAVLRVIRQELDRMMLSRTELATTIIIGDDAAKRLAIFLGFHVDDEGDGAPAATKYGRKRLSDHLDSNEDLLMPAGNGYVIPMGYHAGED